MLDAWAGEAAPGRPWTAATRAVVWSVTKGIAAAAVQRLADRGVLDVEARVAEHWPEFAAAGKQDVRVRDVLAHTAGMTWWEGYERVARIEGAVGWDQPRRIAAALAAARPTLPPGSAAAYHSLTFGWLLDELLLRATGRDARAVVVQELCRPLGLVGLSLGGTPTDLAQLALAQSPQHPAARALADAFAPGTVRGGAMLVTRHDGVLDGATAANLARFRAAPQPACNAVADARSVARVYGALANGGTIDGERWVGASSIEDFSAAAWTGADGISGDAIARALGYQLHSAGQPLAPDPAAFGHAGWGGSVGFALPSAGLGFAYVTNRIELADESARRDALAAAVLAAL